MKNLLYSILGILIPFVGTVFGSCFVFFLKDRINPKFHKLMIGFAIGVMLAASIWSLIIPAVEMAESLKIINFFPASLGLFFGIVFLIVINKFADNIKKNNNVKNINMLLFSVTVHNIPEGMAVGVCFAGILGNANIKPIEAILLCIGIAIQNIPEGAIISIPLSIDGVSKRKAFIYGMLSGVVEPLAAFLTIALLNIVVPLLPYLLSFAAGAMIYVVIEELVPEMHMGNKSYLGIMGVTFGFILMMVLDVALG